jgi:hypothetical protein
LDRPSGTWIEAHQYPLNEGATASLIDLSGSKGWRRGAQGSRPNAVDLATKRFMTVLSEGA